MIFCFQFHLNHLRHKPNVLNKHCMGFFLRKVSCVLAVSHGLTLHRQFPCPMLAQIDPGKIIDYFLWKFVCGLRASIAQVIFLGSAGQVRSREGIIGYSPAYDCVLWANIAQVIFLCSVVSYLDNIG